MFCKPGHANINLSILANLGRQACTGASMKPHICLVLGLFLLAVTSKFAGSSAQNTSSNSSGSTSGSSSDPAALRSTLSSLADSTFRFWQLHGLDNDNGGFHGTLDRAGNPIEPRSKGVIQTGRHAFAMSIFHQSRGSGSTGVRSLPYASTSSPLVYLKVSLQSCHSCTNGQPAAAAAAAGSNYLISPMCFFIT